jgi:hypothetical protein
MQVVRTFNKIPDELSPKLVFKEKDKRIANTYLREQLNTEVKAEKIIYSDSLFNALNGGKSRSFAHITLKNYVLKSCFLSDFRRDIFLKPLQNSSIKLRKILPDSLILGNFIRTQKSNDLLLAFDTQFRRVLVFDTKNKYALSTHITPKSFKPLEVYQCLKGDTIGFHKTVIQYEKILEQIGKKEVEIASAQLYENRLILDISIAYMETANPYKVNFWNGMVEWLGNGKFRKIEIDKKIVNTLKDNNYYSLSFFYLFEPDKDIIYTLVDKSTPDTTDALIAKLKLVKNKFIWGGFTAIKYPAFALATKPKELPYMFTGGSIVYPFYFFWSNNMVVNMENNQKYKVLEEDVNNIFEDGAKHEYGLLAAYQDPTKSNLIILLYRYQSEYFIGHFDKVLKKCVYKKEIMLPNSDKANFVISSWLFSSPTTIWAISAENELIEVSFEK